MSLLKVGLKSLKGDRLSLKLEQGLVQIYTGDGKGKTTASLGLALRAAGRNFRIYIGQFMKTSGFGEHKALEKFSDQITVEQFGSGKYHTEGPPSEEDLKNAEEGLRKIREAMLSKEYDIVIADEICVSQHFDLLSSKDIIDLIDVKPKEIELVLTGRNASEELIERADLVTEMKEIKHPYQEGVEARKGIEM